MNEYALGQYINMTFMPFVPFIAGGVIAITLSLLFYLAIRDGFLKEDNDD